ETTFNLAAAEAVVVVPDEPDAGQVLDGVHALAQKSLLRAHRPNEPVFEPRFSLYASVREYAAVRLEESGARAAVEARFADYFLTHGERWEAGCDGDDGPALLGRLGVEHDNVLAVHRCALAVRPATAGAARAAMRAALVMSPQLSSRATIAA